MTTKNLSSASSRDSVDVSIVICTRDRADSLQRTVSSIDEALVPGEWEVELIVVDNASRDDTEGVIDQYEFSDIQPRTLKEERVGLSYARNTALASARGEVLLFTDDDVQVPTNWIAEMAAPIRAGRADAVAGGVRLPPHLRRPWQGDDPWLTSFLATTHVLSPEQPERMVGANMAIARHVMDSLPGFDLDLGPGSELGLGDETLLSLQLKEAGFRLISAFDVAVEHHMDEDRLTRKSYLRYAEQVGRSQGYIDYHWKHGHVRPVALLIGLLMNYGKLIAGRLFKYKDVQQPEGLPGWEMSLLTQIYHKRQFLAESRQERKYKRSPQRTNGQANAPTKMMSDAPEDKERL